MSLLTLAEIRRTRPRATEWVTADDISGTGTEIVSSGAMSLVLASLPPLADMPMIEVQFTQASLTDSVLSWVEVRNVSFFDGVQDNTVASTSFNTAAVPGGGAGGANTRTVRIKPLMLYHLSADSRTYNPYLLADRLRVFVRSRGYQSETQWSVTGIRARLVYTPL